MSISTLFSRSRCQGRESILRSRVLSATNTIARQIPACITNRSAEDATFVTAKGGGSEIGTTKGGKGMKIMAIVDRHGLPLSISTHAANHHDCSYASTST